MNYLRRRLTFAFLLGAVAFVPGCGDGGADPEAVDGTMHATIAGSSDPWDAEKSLSATMTNGKLVIKGVENSTIAISLTVYDAAVGSFTAAGNDQVPTAEATYGDERSFSYTSAKMGGMVTIVITELTATKAVGTFTFVAIPIIADLEGTDQYHVTNGAFDVIIR